MDFDPEDLPSSDVDDARESCEIQALLLAVSRGEREAEAELFSRVEDDLRRNARQMLRAERAGHTLETAALINEAWIRIAGSDRSYEGRSHFLRVSARAMRRVLIDHARARMTHKRGGERARVEFNERGLATVSNSAELLVELDESLDKLEELDSELSRVVELRIFAGLSSAEIAEVMEVSARTVERAWKLGSAWIQNAISRE